MSQVFSRDGFRELLPAWVLLGVSVAAAVAIVAGSQWYFDRERRESATAGQRMSQARARVDGARRERENQQASAETFRALLDRGLLGTEQRLDMVELVNTLRTRHNLQALDYEIGAQRPLNLGSRPGYVSMEVLSSRVKIKARALHEGDLLGFIADLTEGRQGFYPIDRCMLRRLEGPEESMRPRVEAECALEWITLKGNRG